MIDLADPPYAVETTSPPVSTVIKRLLVDWRTVVYPYVGRGLDIGLPQQVHVLIMIKEQFAILEICISKINLGYHTTVALWLFRRVLLLAEQTALGHCTQFERSQ